MNSLNGLSYKGKLINFKLNSIRNVKKFYWDPFLLNSSILDSSRQKSLLAVQFAGSIALRLVSYTSLILFFSLNSQVSVFSLDLFRREIDSIPFAADVLAFPQGEKGQMGAAVWALMVYLAMKELFNFL